MCETRRKLAESGEAVGAPHRSLGFLQMTVGFGELLRGGLVFACRGSVGFGKLMGQVSDHRQEQDAEKDFGNLGWVDFLIRSKAEDEREERCAGESGGHGRA